MISEHSSSIASEQAYTKRLIRMKQVQDMTGLSRSYLYDLSNRGIFPKSISLVPGGTAKAWDEQEVHDWIDQRIAAREEA